MSETTDPIVAALVVLKRKGVPPDVLEMLIRGSLANGVAPGALAEAIDAAMDASEEAERIANICDVPGCGKPATSGWPSATGYRRTCFRHSDIAPGGAAHLQQEPGGDG